VTPVDVPRTWVRALRPALLSRIATAIAGVGLWPIVLLVGGTLVNTSREAYLSAALCVACGHTLAGLLFRATARQGLWVGSDGSLRLCSPYGELVLAAETVDRALLVRYSGSALVWSQGRVWWLETSARVPIVRPSDKALEGALIAIRDAASYEVGFAEDSQALSGESFTGLEFSFRGFSRVIRAPGVWISVLLGQLLLLTALP